MKTVEVGVRSNKEDLGSVNVEQFDSLAEAADFYQAEAVKSQTEEKPAADNAGELRALELINQQHKANVTNAYRASKTRSQSPITILRNALASKPELKNDLEALLKAHDLPTNLD